MGLAPGTSLGVIGGLWGSFAGVLGPHRPGSCWAPVAVAGRLRRVLLVAACVAFAQGQPYGVWYGLGLPGLLGTVMGATFLVTLRPVILRAHREAEERRIQARDLG